jgi:hypothetical protein
MKIKKILFLKLITEAFRLIKGTKETIRFISGVKIFKLKG